MHFVRICLYLSSLLPIGGKSPWQPQGEFQIRQQSNFCSHVSCQFKSYKIAILYVTGIYGVILPRQVMNCQGHGQGHDTNIYVIRKIQLNGDYQHFTLQTGCVTRFRYYKIMHCVKYSIQ